jgi:hypothetical protein
MSLGKQKEKTMKEQWLPIKGYETHYEVSNYGRVRNIPRIIPMYCKGGQYLSKQTINKLSPNNKGYGRVFLSKHSKVCTKYVHRLVAEHFCPNPLGYKEVNHIDGNKENNRASNLEWVSRRQNCVHARRNNLFIPAPSKLTIKEVDSIVAMRKNGVSRKEVAKMHGVGETNITCITSGRIWAWYTGIGKRSCIN